MYKTVNLYVANTGAAGTNAALSWTSTVKGKITAIEWRFSGTQGGAASSATAELSSTPIYQSESNDTQGILSTCAVAFNAGGAGNPVCQTVVHNGFAYDLAVGDRLYVNILNSAAPTTAKWSILLTISV